MKQWHENAIMIMIMNYGCGLQESTRTCQEERTKISYCIKSERRVPVLLQHGHLVSQTINFTA